MSAETVGKYIALDWYDGPFTEIARVDFDDNDPVVQLRTLFMHLEGESADPRQAVVLRLDRKTVQAMMDLLDGKPVKGWRDR